MTKEAIVQLLEEKHQNLYDWLANQSEENWMKGPKDKWTTGQHILHLSDSLEMLNKGLSYPKFILKSKFGVRNRDLRDYKTVSENYFSKLKISQEKATTFNSTLKTPSLSERSKLITKLKTAQEKLQRKTSKWKDIDLDTYLLPHPLMGRMPIREIIMWTACHTEHHTNTLKENY